MAVNKNDLQKILDQIEALTGKKITLDLDTKGPQELAQLFDTYEEKLINIRKQSSLLNMSLQETRDISKAIVQEMTKQNKTVQAARSAMTGLTGIATELLNEEREISALNQKRLSTLVKQAKINKQSLDDQATYIKRTGESTSEAIKRLKTESQSLNLRTKAGRQRAGEIANEKTILRAALDQEGIYDQIVKTAEKRLKLEQATTKSFGLTGAALSAASTIAGKFGMSHVSEELDDIQTKLSNDIRKAVELNNDKALGFAQRFQFAGKAISQTVGVLAKGMMDPLFIMGKIYTAFLDVNVAAVEYGRLTGKNGVNTAAMNSSLASSVDVLKVMAEITKEIGLDSSSVFSDADLGRLAEAKNLLGLSDKQASNLGTRSKVAGIGIRDYEKGIVGATNKYNTLNRSTIGHGAVLQEVLNTSDSISLSLAGNPDKLSAAASAAIALGLNLQRVDDIAASLTEFQSSISNELEAELLTGKQLNLEKAREYALSNDLAGLAKELSANGASAAEFSSMNRLQQESLAKALGMSRDELAKSIQLEALRKGLGKDAVEAAGDMTLAQVEQLDIQTRLKISLDKLAQAFSPILQAIIPIAEALASVILPIASVIGHIASGVSGLIKPLLIVYGIYKGALMLQQVALGVQTALNVQGMIAANRGLATIGTNRTIAALESRSLIAKTAGNALLLAQLVYYEGIAGLKMFANGLDDKSIAKKIILKGFDLAESVYLIFKNGLGMTELGTRGAIAAAASLTTAATAGQLALMPGLVAAEGALAAESVVVASSAIATNAAATFGLGTLAIVGALAAVAGATAAYFTMKDGVIDPKKGPVVSGEFGSVQLHPNDQIVAGTDLMGKKSGQSISTAAAGNDTHNEIKQMREENKSLLTALLNKSGNVYMDSNKVGKAHVLGSYKSA